VVEHEREDSVIIAAPFSLIG